MNHKEYIDKKLNEAVEDWQEVNGTEIRSSISKDMKMKDGSVIPAGTKIKFVFVRKGEHGPFGIKVTEMDSGVYPVPFLVSAGSQRIQAIRKNPSMRTLQKWTYDVELPKSVTGKTVEPDGWGSDGSPSWLLVLGMI